MDRQDANRTWETLSAALDEIYNRNASQLSFEELYRSSYNLVLHKHGDLLYDGVSEKVTQHLSKTVYVLAEETVDEALLAATSIAWQDHVITMTMIRDILMYMDRIYTCNALNR